MKNKTFMTYQGDHVDTALLAELAIHYQLPEGYQNLVLEVNGFVQFNGGIHIRGVVRTPDWHSLMYAMEGDHAYHELYAMIEPTDIMFGEDCVGSQYFLRQGVVYFLDTQTGELENLEMDFSAFIEQMQAEPVQMLGMYPVLQFQDQDQTLKPGEVLAEKPYMFTKEAEKGVALKAIDTTTYRLLLAKVCAQVLALPEDEEYSMVDFEGLTAFDAEP